MTFFFSFLIYHVFELVTFFQKHEMYTELFTEFDLFQFVKEYKLNGATLFKFNQCRVGDIKLRKQYEGGFALPNKVSIR